MKRKMLALLSLVILIIISSLNVYPQQQSSLELHDKPILKIINDSSNTKMAIQYAIQTPSFVELIICDRLGEITAVPIFEFQDSGEHSLVYNKINLLAGSYRINLILNHDRSSEVTRGFDNKISGKVFTYSRKEENYLNRAMMSTAESPEKSKLLYDTLLTNYPNYIDRRLLFTYAFSAYMMASDSGGVFALADSIEKYSPNSEIYSFISMSTAFFKKYISIGIKYSQKAIGHIDDVPSPYRNSYLFKYQRMLGENYLANNNFDLAFKAFKDALNTYHLLPMYDNAIKYESDIDIIGKLGLICETQKNYNEARSYYKIALTRDPTNTDNWLALQRIYISLNHSDEGYNVYKENFLKTIPKEKLAGIKTERFIGKTFPKFLLNTIDGKKYSDKDMKGKVSVINYWAYSCGWCLKERPDLEKIYQEFKNDNFTLISLHSQIGRFNNYEEEKALIEKVLKKYPATFPTLIETNDKNTPRIGVDGIPTTVIVDKKGVIRYEEIGYDQYQFYTRMKENIYKLLEEK